MILSLNQKRMLETLIHFYCVKGKLVSAKEIADELDAHPGTIRNNVKNMVTFGLVESISGPRGGYIPTEDGYAAVRIESNIKAASVLRDCSVLKEVGAGNVAIDLSTNEIKVKLIGRLSNINPGDRLTIISEKFKVMGTVLSKDENFHQIIIDGHVLTRK